MTNGDTVYDIFKLIIILIFAIAAIWLFIPHLYVYISLVIFIIAFVIATYYAYTRKGMFLPTKLLKAFWNWYREETKRKRKEKKTPPCPERLKNKLYFERANQKCEWCGKWTDQPQIHHIEPRANKGPNNPYNLMVLCCECHGKAPNIGKSKLRYKVGKKMEEWDRP